MRNKIVWLIIIFIAGLSFQSANSQGFEGKLIFGFNASQVDGDQTFGYNLVRPVVGLAGAMGLSKKTELQLEIFYSPKGAGAARNQPYINSRLHYIDIPLLINFKLTKKWVPQIGLSTNYLVYAEADFSGWEYHEITRYLRRYDFCIVGGLEFRPDINWGFNIRYGYSAVPYNIPDPGFLYNSGWFNNYITLSIRYSFIKPKKYL